MLDEPAEWIDTEAQLNSHYGQPKRASTVKVSPVITEHYARWIKASPFCAFASIGPEGIDCSPRGDAGQVVDIVDETTLALPDRRGNNRIDTLRNIVRDPRVSVMFLIPGSGTVIRINGTARVTADPRWLSHYAREGQQPRTVVVVTVGEIYFQCARAVMRSRLWSAPHVDEATLPSIGTMLEAMSRAEEAADATGKNGGDDRTSTAAVEPARDDERVIDGASYDAQWPDRAASTLW